MSHTHNTQIYFLLAPLLFLFSYSAATNPNGHPDCPCLKQPFNNKTEHYLCRSKTATGECYKISYGAEKCDIHSIIHNETGCVGATRTTERDRSYCEAKWCYVDPNNCWKPHSASSFFDQPANSTQYYSYETCGNLDSYSLSEIDSVFSRYSGVNDGKLRVQVPGDDALGVRTLEGAEYEGLEYGNIRTFREFGKVGHAVEFMEDVLNSNRVYNFEIVEKSEDSAVFSPGSSFTACIHDIALNNTDICVGNFWMTEARQLIKNFRFTSSTYQDNFYLISRKTDAGSAVLDLKWLAGLAVEPFESVLWLIIVLALIFMGFCKWLVEGWDNDDDYPAKNRSEALWRSMFFSFQAFLGNGDFKETPYTAEGQISYLASSLCILVLLTAYLAQMTTILGKSEVFETEFISLEDAINRQATVCCMNAIKSALMARHKKLGTLKDKFVGFESTGWALEAMGGGYKLVEGYSSADASAQIRSEFESPPDGFCDVVIASGDEYEILLTGDYSMDDQYKYFSSQKFLETGTDRSTAHCDKIKLDEILYTIDNGYPVSLELSYALNYRVADHKAQGKYAVKKEKVALEHGGANKCLMNELNAQSDSLPASRVSGIVVLSTFVCGLCTLWHYMKTKKLESARFVSEPSFINRFLGSGSGNSKKFGGDPELNNLRKNREARIIARENGSFDLTLISDILHNRSKIEQMCSGKGIKTDSPLTLRDIPSIFKVMIMMFRDTQIKPEFINLFLQDSGKGVDKVKVASKVQHAKLLFKKGKHSAPVAATGESDEDKRRGSLQPTTDITGGVRCSVKSSSNERARLSINTLDSDSNISSK